jgi:hypothetical protein
MNEPLGAKLAHIGAAAGCTVALANASQQNVEFVLHIVTGVAGALAALCSAAYYIVSIMRKRKADDK